MKFEYLLFNLNPDRKVCTIKNIPKKIPDSFQLKEGIKIGASYPADVILDISLDSGDILTDFIDNISRSVLISSDVKDVFETEGINEDIVEYLPFKIMDKKKRLIDQQYYIANVLVSINCFDFSKSEYTKSKRTGTLLDVETIVISEEKIPADAKLFRIGEYPSRIVIRSDLLNVLQQKGFTGISVIKQGESFI